MVALTFDDGPDAAATRPILDRLADRGVAATFFVLGAHAEAHPELIGRMVEAGHGVQPHCWDWESHGCHLALGRPAAEDDIRRTIGALESLGCPAPTLWRPPNGDIADPQTYEVAEACGLRLVTWTLQTCDWHDDHSAERILADVDSEAREDAVLGADSVVLMHDKPKTPRLLGGLLDRIEARGYQVGLLGLGSRATARGGDYRFGRRDGRTPCGRVIQRLRWEPEGAP
jgi:peptidoglycan/xylan/chitin deacetylase (PgdA/CDA1 family)